MDANGKQTPASGSKLDFDWLAKFLKELLDDDPELALALGAITALTEVIKKSKEATLMGLRHELEEATSVLVRVFGSTSMSVKSGADIFLCFVTRTWLEIPDFHACKMRLVERGEQLKAQTMTARKHIASFADSFLRDGMTILSHGYSRVVYSIIDAAVSKGKRITVVQTEARPQSDGIRMAERLSIEANVPTTLIPDSAVAYVMSEVDMIIVGAEAVAENGGIINKIGTYQLAIVSKALNKPFYVAVESFKMTRIYPLNQHEINNRQVPLENAKSDMYPMPMEKLRRLAPDVRLNSPSLDFTPPQYITLLFTDLGILTPSAVSDELIKLYS